MKNIQLRDTRGKIIFEYEKVDNTIKDTLEEAAKQRVNLSHVNLPKVNLRGLDLARKEIGVDLSHANFSGSDMTFSRLQNAYLTNTKFIYTNFKFMFQDYLSDRVQYCTILCPNLYRCF